MMISVRHNQVTEADIAIRTAVVEAAEHNELTYGELMMILGGIIMSWARSEVRGEREEAT